MQKLTLFKLVCSGLHLFIHYGVKKTLVQFSPTNYIPSSPNLSQSSDQALQKLMAECLVFANFMPKGSQHS